MKKLSIIIALLCTGCTGMFLRYSYEPALKSLPDCSKVHAINNDYITYSKVEPKVETKIDVLGHTVYTNYVISVTNFYRAYYGTEGNIYKTVLTTNGK